MSPFNPGDRVHCTSTWTTHVVDNGHEYTVEDVRHGVTSPEILVNGEWVPVTYFELVESGAAATLADRLRRIEAQVEEWERIAAQPFPGAMRDWASVHAAQIRIAMKEDR